MPHPLTSSRHRAPLAAIALLAFTLRALIPAGFMPSGTGFFDLAICPEGLSPEVLAKLDPHFAHHHHSGAHDHQSWSTNHCPFAALASAPPTVQLVAAAPALVSVAIFDARDLSLLPESLRFRIAQPRGPPTPA